MAIRFGISTWSIHRALEADCAMILDVPAMLQQRGMTDLQICHFHLPQRDDAYLNELRARMKTHAITLDAMLLDFGDLSHETKGAADADELAKWLPTAARLGAKYARISAGSQRPTEASLARSAGHLNRLAAIGETLGVRVITENWHELMPGSREVLRMMDLTHGRVPICLDFGNWSGPGKYDELEAVAAHAVTVHAKCAFTAEGVADAEDFARCCDVLRRANYDGTIALIYDSAPPDEWQFIEQELDLAKRSFAK